MYLYETHLHTSPVSDCARATVRESLEFYKSAGYTGVFITDHFIDSNIDEGVREYSYADRIKYYFSSYNEGVEIGREIGLDVFSGIEMGQGWAHILVYGIDEAWCLEHPEMETMRKRELLPILKDAGAILVQAHPFRKTPTEITLFPQFVHGVEILNTGRGDFENKLAAQFCENYELIPFAGSDNHRAGEKTDFGGIATDHRLKDFEDFKATFFSGGAKPFRRNKNGLIFL